MIASALMLLMSVLGAAGDESQSKPTAPAAPVQDPDRPALSATELKSLRETNIFSPKTVKRAPTRPTPDFRKTPQPYRQKAPVVTGIFLDLNTQAHQAIVEDKNDSAHKYFKEPKFMKVGDEWAGIKLESIGPDKAVFNKGGTTKEVRIGESLPESEAKPLSAPGENLDDPFGDDGDGPPPESVPSKSSPPPSKYSKSSRPDSSGSDAKAMTPEVQTKTIEEMKKRMKKKNRPGDPEE